MVGVLITKKILEIEIFSPLPASPFLLFPTFPPQPLRYREKEMVSRAKETLSPKIGPGRLRHGRRGDVCLYADACTRAHRSICQRCEKQLHVPDLSSGDPDCYSEGGV